MAITIYICMSHRPSTIDSQPPLYCRIGCFIHFNLQQSCNGSKQWERKKLLHKKTSEISERKITLLTWKAIQLSCLVMLLLLRLMCFTSHKRFLSFLIGSRAHVKTHQDSLSRTENLIHCMLQEAEKLLVILRWNRNAPRPITRNSFLSPQSTRTVVAQLNLKEDFIDEEVCINIKSTLQARGNNNVARRISR